MSIIRGKLYNLHKYTNNKNNSERKKCVNKSANELSKLYKVSPRTIQNDDQFVEEYPEEAEKIYNGEMTRIKFMTCKYMFCLKIKYKISLIKK